MAYCRRCSRDFRTGIVESGADPDDEAAEQVGFHLLVDVDVAVAGLDQSGAELLPLHIAERMAPRRHAR